MYFKVPPENLKELKREIKTLSHVLKMENVATTQHRSRMTHKHLLNTGLRISRNLLRDKTKH